MDQLSFKYVVVKIMTQSNESLEQRNIKLQQRIFDMNWSILKAIELLEKENNKKALKILKKVLYE